MRREACFTIKSLLTTLNLGDSTRSGHLELCGGVVDIQKNDGDDRLREDEVAEYNDER